MSRSSIVCWCVRQSWMQSKATKGHNICRSLDSLLRHNNQIAVLSAKKPVLSAFEEGEACRTSKECWWSFMTDSIADEFVRPCQTVNEHYHLEVLQWLREQVRRNGPERLSFYTRFQKSVPAALPDRWTRCLNSEVGNSEGDNDPRI